MILSPSSLHLYFSRSVLGNYQNYQDDNTVDTTNNHRVLRGGAFDIIFNSS